MNRHIRILQVLNWIFAGLVALTLVIVVGSTVATVAMLQSMGEAGKPIVNATLALNGGTIVVMMLSLGLLVIAALRLPAGQGRLAQTLLALLSLLNCPMGTAFAAYSIWVLWINDTTAAIFEPENATPVSRRRQRFVAATMAVVLVCVGTVLGAAVLVVSVLTLVPLDAKTVADLHPPIEDRSGRDLDPTQCGLNQAPTNGTCVDVRRRSFDEEEVRFASRLTDKGLAELQGTLTLPKGMDAPRPGVVIVHGSGPNLRDGLSPGDLIARYDPQFAVYQRLSHELAAQGLVVLRYDKRTAAVYHDKGLDFGAFEFSDFVDDAKDGLDFLATRPEVDSQALVVVGHSQGGQLAPHIAQGDDRVAAVLLMGGSTQTLGEMLIEQSERLGQVRKTRADYLTQLVIPFSTASFKACFEPIWRNEVVDPDAPCLFGLTNQTIANYEALAATTGGVLLALDAPVMAIQGTCDINIDPAEIGRMQALMKGRDAEFHHVYGLDHALTSLVEPQTPVTFDPEALDRISTFLASVPWQPKVAEDSAGP